MKKTQLFGAISKALIGTTALIAATQTLAEEITVWAWDPNFNIAIMKDAAEAYKKDHADITFKIVDMAKADLEQKLQTTLASGVTKSLPDIVLIEDYNAPKYLHAFPGAFAGLNDKIDYSTFAKYKVNVMTIDGATYGVPFDSGVTGFYFRRDLLEQAGYSEKDLQNITWEKYIEIGKAVKAKTGKAMMAADPYEPGLIRVMMQSAGSWYFDQEGKLNIKDNATLKAALETHKALMSSGISKQTSGWGEWVGALNSGDVASVTTGVWITGSVKAELSQSGKWGIAPIPSLGIEGATNASNLGGSSWYVLASSPEKEAAISFLKDVYVENTDFYQQILQKYGAMGSNLKSRSGEIYSKPDPFFGNTKVWQSFSDWSKAVPSVNYGMYTNEADAAVVSLLPALAEGMPVEKVMEEIHNQVASQIQ